jgi:hypothetical protein
MLTPGIPRINPLIPSHWSWVGLRELPYHGALLSYFLVRESTSGFRVYSTGNVDSDWDVMLYARDVSDEVRVYADCAVAIALARDDGMAILVGNTGDETMHTPLNINETALFAKRAMMRVYNSERGDWEAAESIDAAQLRGLALTIEAGGFRLLELSALGPAV